MRRYKTKYIFTGKTTFSLKIYKISFSSHILKNIKYIYIKKQRNIKNKKTKKKTNRSLDVNCMN